MATPFSEVIDLAMITIQDYKLDKLFQISESDWATFLSGFVVRAVPKFTNSKTPLNYDLTAQTFNNTLSLQEINILVYWFIEIWLERCQQELSQIKATMTPSDAKRTNVPQLIKERQVLIDECREKNSQTETVYGINNVNWINWGNGNFWG